MAQANGDVIIVRYVNNAVFGFQYESEGRKFLKTLSERVEAYGLKLHPVKTRLVELWRFAASNRSKRRNGKPETFDFLGFTHICAVSRRGKFWIRRKTIRKRLRWKLEEVKAMLIRLMHDPLEKVGKWLASVIRVIRWRSQKARCRWTWERFYRLQ